MKFTYSVESRIIPASSIACTASGDTSVFTTGVPACATAPGVDAGTGDAYIIATGLKSNEFSYSIEIQNVNNAPVSGMYSQDLKCEFCKDDLCTQLYETGTNARITYVEAALPANDVEILSDDRMNGAEQATLTIGMLLGNLIVPEGTITLNLPK